jgi:hypothetical protein
MCGTAAKRRSVMTRTRWLQPAGDALPGASKGPLTKTTRERKTIKLLSIYPAALLLLTAVMSLASCTPGDSRSAHKDSKTRTGTNPDITIKTQEGRTFSLFVNRDYLPPQWPADIPVLSGGSILTSQIDSAGQRQQITVSTERSSEEILNVYWKELQSRGWKVQHSQDSMGARLISASKEQRESLLKIIEAGSVRHIQITARENQLH